MSPDKLKRIDEIREALRLELGCAFLIVSPEDVREQWQINMDADETEGDEPTEAEIARALESVHESLQNNAVFDWGPASEACELIRCARAAKSDFLEVRTWKEKTK